MLVNLSEIETASADRRRRGPGVVPTCRPGERVTDQLIAVDRS
jgi:hypothetical protein